MKKLYLYGVVLLVSIMPNLVSALPNQKSAVPNQASTTQVGASKFMCASVDVMECLSGNGCQKVSADDINIPRFFKVDVTKKTIITGLKNDQRKTDIERMEILNGKLILQGAEGGGVGWTMAVSKNRNDMVLTASGDDAAFVVFGPCTSM